LCEAIEHAFDAYEVIEQKAYPMATQSDVVTRRRQAAPIGEELGRDDQAYRIGRLRSPAKRAAIRQDFHQSWSVLRHTATGFGPAAAGAKERDLPMVDRTEPHLVG